MPEIDSVKSLRRICVDFVVNNIDSFSKESLASKLKANDSENVPFSFEELPSAVLEDLVEALRKISKKVYKKFIHLLVVPNLRTLNLSICSPIKDFLSRILPLAARNCPNLTSLVISGHYYSDYYFSLIQTFTKLQILDISNTSTPDVCFKLIGSYCKDLRELHAKNCALTNTGIKGLCVNGQCKSIQILNLMGTKVTYKGIIMTLQHLPFLRELNHPSAFKVLAEIHKNALYQRLSDIPKFSLSSIQIIDNPPNWNLNLESAVLLCPLITEVTFGCNLRKLTDKDLLGLLPLEKLENLTISGYGDNVNLTFDGGLAPFLKARGSTLKTLALSTVHKVDYIPFIAQYCSNLRSLFLRNISSSNASCSESQRDSFRRQRNKLEQPKLKYLEKLDLAFSNGIMPESFCILLSSPSLKFINIRSCDTFTDDLLRHAANLHSFSNLQSFELDDCKLATTEILEVLLQENSFNHLNWIRLTWNEKEPENFSQILQHWKEEKENNRWNVKMLVKYFDIQDTSDDGEDEVTSDANSEDGDTYYEDVDRSDYSEDEDTSSDDSEDLSNKVMREYSSTESEDEFNI